MRLERNIAHNLFNNWCFLIKTLFYMKIIWEACQLNVSMKNGKVLTKCNDFPIALQVRNDVFNGSYPGFMTVPIIFQTPYSLWRMPRPLHVIASPPPRMLLNTSPPYPYIKCLKIVYVLFYVCEIKDTRVSLNKEQIIMSFKCMYYICT